MGATEIKISLIRRDGGTQPRAEINREVVEQYAEALRNGETLKPVDVFYDGKEYWLSDGFHRIQAHELADHRTINCTVHQGNLEAARWASYAANKAHDVSGLRRTNADKERAVCAALKHPKAESMSERDIANYIGVSKTMVHDYRASGHGDQIDTRTVTRNGKTFEMKTGNIGKRHPIDDMPPGPERAAAITALLGDDLEPKDKSPRRERANPDEEDVPNYTPKTTPKPSLDETVRQLADRVRIPAAAWEHDAIRKLVSTLQTITAKGAAA